MKRHSILSLFLYIVVDCITAVAQTGVYNVRDYGAKGDGKTLDSPAINAAIESAVRDGGGQVLLPAGTYLSGSIHLKSNVDLHLAAGSKLLAAPASMKAYDESESFGGFPEYQDGGHTYFHNSLIWAEGQSNVSITGHGMIDGEGLTKKDTEKAGQVQGGSIGTGDKAIALKRCRQVTIRDITIFRGGHFAIIMTGCDLSTIDNVTIDTNRDGFDIDCCKYMTITNCKINTPSDDALVLKSSYALKKPVITEHIAITNCNITGYKCGTLLDGTYVPEPVNWVCGRFKLGTESNGGYRNISLTNCTFMYSSGMAFEEVDQGRMENIVVSNITMSHVHHYPIYITTGCRNRGPREVTKPSTARDIQISNVIADDCDSLCSIIVTGMPGAPIQNVWLSDIRLYFKGGGTRELVNKEYREQGTNYPEPKFAGWTPAYGLYARHVRGLHVSDVTFRYEHPDYRPAVVFDDVQDATINALDAPTEEGIEQVVRLEAEAVPVILTAGQSNADGRVPMNNLPETLKNYNHCRWSYGSGDFETATGLFSLFSPRVAKPGIEQSWGFDAVVYKGLEELWQQPFYVIKHTDGGTAIDPSCKASTHGLYWSADPAFLDSTTSASHGGKSLLKAFCRQIDDCLPNLPRNYDIKCLIWHQGESDQQAADHYYNNMKAVVDYIRQHLVTKTGQQRYAKLPVVCATFSSKSRQGSAKVAEALRQLGDDDPNFYVVDANDLSLLSDQLHFDASGAEELGKRIISSIITLTQTTNESKTD